MGAEGVTPTETPAPTPETEAPAVKTWKENFHVKESTEIEKVERLAIIAGVNEYKGEHLVFLAKVTDKDFSRQFFSMPAWVWEKSVPVIQGYAGRIAEIEKKAMAEKALEELKRLQELGVDVKALVKQLGVTK